MTVGCLDFGKAQFAMKKRTQKNIENFPRFEINVITSKQSEFSKLNRMMLA